MSSVVNHHEIPDWVPVEKWPTLHDLCDGFDENLMPASSKLGGSRIVLVFDNGSHVDHHFIDDSRLTWSVVKGQDDHVGLSDKAAYKAFEVRSGIFFVDFYKEAYEEQVSLVMDLNSGRVVVAISGFHGKDDKRRTRTVFNNAYVEGLKSTKPFEPTTELIGKHIKYRYTGNDVYEHIYFNQGTFSWHCLSGTEKGLADTEPCKMLKLSEKLYLLFWTEKIMPVESVVVVDLQEMRSTGRFFCWDPKPGKLVQTLFGSRATLLGDSGVWQNLS